jgi:thiamine transporter
MQNKKNLRILVECAIMIALAAVLSEFKVSAPFGGSVTIFSMVPIIIIGFRHGPGWGLGTAFVYSMAQFMFDASKLSGWGVAGAKAMVLCTLFDYVVAFTVLGLSGFFKAAMDKSGQRGKKIAIASAATLFVCVLRYLSHVLVGAVLWYELFKETIAESAWVYSTVYNMQYMLPETIITLVAAPAVVTVLSVITKQKE